MKVYGRPSDHRGWRVPTRGRLKGEFESGGRRRYLAPQVPSAVSRRPPSSGVESTSVIVRILGSQVVRNMQQPEPPEIAFAFAHPVVGHARHELIVELRRRQLDPANDDVMTGDQLSKVEVERNVQRPIEAPSPHVVEVSSGGLSGRNLGHRDHHVGSRWLATANGTLGALSGWVVALGDRQDLRGVGDHLSLDGGALGSD